MTVYGGEATNENTFQNSDTGTRLYLGSYGFYGDPYHRDYTLVPSAFVVRSMGAVFLNNFLFLFASDNETWTTVSKRYNASTSEWLDLTPVPHQATVASTVTICGDEIFLLGGMFVTKESKTDYSSPYIRDAYKYIIARNEWEKIADLPQPVVEAASCSVDNIVYVSGGRDPSNTTAGTNTLYAFDTNACQWLTKPSMVQSRRDHCMEAVENKLYVLGGSNGSRKHEWDWWPHVPMIEIYNLETEQWSSIEPTFSVHGASSFVTGKTINITGGYRKGRWNCSDPNISNDIHALDTAATEKGTKHQYNNMPVKTAYHFCCWPVVQK